MEHVESRGGLPLDDLYWFKLDIAKYNHKTQHLSLLEHGVYFALMRNYYATGKPLPSDTLQLQRICRAHSIEEIEAISRVIFEFFSLKNGVYHNSKCDKELVAARKLSRLRRSAALTRHHAKRMQMQSICTESNSNSNSKEIKSKTTGAKRAQRLPEDFTPKAEHYELAKAAGIILDMEFPKFRDYFLGSGKPKLNWDATLRVWIRNAVNYGKNRGNNQTNRQPSAQVERFNNNLAEVERAFGREVAVGVAVGATGAGQTPRLGTGDPPALEGEIEGLQRRGNW